MTQPQYPWRLWYRQTNSSTWTFAGHFLTRRDLDQSKSALEQKGCTYKPEYLGKPVGLPSTRRGGDEW